MKRHDDWLKEQLQDPEFAADYLTAAAEDPEPSVYLHALRGVAYDALREDLEETAAQGLDAALEVATQELSSLLEGARIKLHALPFGFADQLILAQPDGTVRFDSSDAWTERRLPPELLAARAPVHPDARGGAANGWR